MIIFWSYLFQSWEKKTDDDDGSSLYNTKRNNGRGMHMYSSNIARNVGKETEKETKGPKNPPILTIVPSCQDACK